MKSYRIQTALKLPVVSAVVVGPQSATRAQLIFDSGSVATQLHIGTLCALGFRYDNRNPDIKMKGVMGEAESGYSTVLRRLHILGKRFEQYEIAAFDFSAGYLDACL